MYVLPDGDFYVSDTSIQKHLKRKEYPTSLDFANDVELVFSNALEFNVEHTPIWEDAIILRVRFTEPQLRVVKI